MQFVRNEIWKNKKKNKTQSLIVGELMLTAISHNDCHVRLITLLDCYEVVNIFGFRCPASPNPRMLTLPSGLIVSQVSEACFSDILSQASGGNWRALHTKYLITLA